MKHKIKSEWVVAKNLKLKAEYQRDLGLTRITGMAAAFNDALVGAIEVAKRSDGEYVVIDGQHRVATVQKVDPRRKMLCVVHQGLTVAQEAQLFRDLNGKRVRVDRISDYTAALVAQDPEALEIEVSLRKHGMRVGKHQTERAIQAVAALYSVRRTGNLDAVLGVVSPWRSSSQSSVAFEGNILVSVSEFLRVHSDADPSVLRDRLCKNEEPSKVLARIRNRSHDEGKSVRHSGAYVIRDVYNYRNRRPVALRIAA